MVSAIMAVIPAKAGIHVCFRGKIKMDSAFRRNDGMQSLISQPRWHARAWPQR